MKERAEKSKKQVEAIVLDQEALQQTQKLAKHPEHQGKPCLRVYLEGKGCDGFTYGVCFDQKLPNDYVFPHPFVDETINLVCDPDSYQFIRGSSITFVNDERGAGYVVDNPRHKRFRGKFYKKKIWQQRLEDKRKEIEAEQSD